MAEFILVENTGVETSRGIFSSLLLLPLLSTALKNVDLWAFFVN